MAFIIIDEDITMNRKDGERNDQHQEIESYHETNLASPTINKTSSFPTPPAVQQPKRSHDSFDSWEDVLDVTLTRHM